MNDTPRTDVECFGVEVSGPGGAGTVTEYRVDVDFSRQLERELNAANKRIELLENALLPFAQIGDIENDSDCTLWKRAVSAGSVRIARGLLESKP